MAGPVTWRGSNGDWTMPTGWSGFQQPGSGDAVTIDGAGNTVTLGAGESGAALSVLLTGDTLALLGSLALGGPLTVSDGGALELAGTLSGGTLSVGPGGSLLAEGGTLDGVALGAGAGTLGGVSITAATATANAGGSIAVAGTLTLDGGSYDDIGFVLASPTAELDAASGSVVTLGPGAQVTLAIAQPTLGPTDDTLSLGGGGTLLNDGTITSSFVPGPGGSLAIVAARFVNDGAALFGVFSQFMSGEFPVGISVGPHGLTSTLFGELDWLAFYAPLLQIATPQFVNAGTFGLNGGTIEVQSGNFDNQGMLLLSDAVGTTPVQQNGTFAVVADTLTTLLHFDAGVSGFANTGTIIADTVEFDGSVALASLGNIEGALDFEGTLDLGGATLDASAFGTVTIGGTVRNGVLEAGSGELVLHGTTLQGVSVAAGGSVVATGPITLLDPPAGLGTVVLDAITTELGFTGLTASADNLTVMAGSTGAVDRLAEAAGGTLTLGPSFTLVEVAGTTDIAAGASRLVLQGALTAESGVLDIGAMLDGDGTITIGGGAAVTIESLAPSASITVRFAEGPALLVMPGGGAGVTLAGLHAGDVIDFTSVSSVPGTVFVESGAALDSGTGGSALDVTGASGDTATVPVVDPAGSLTFNAQSDGTGAGGTLVTAACFRAGTRIATPGGAVAVERLRIGDTVLTATGEVRRIKWLGRRHYAAAEVRANPQLRPVRIAPGALAEGSPAQALEISAEHALWVGGALVPAGALVNGRSITRAGDGGDVAYVHIELAEHALILADGAAAESFVAAIPRAVFDNADEYAALYPEEGDAAPPPSLPRATGGEAVARAWAACAARAGVAMCGTAAGELRGHAERVANGVLEGWACDAAWPARFELLADGVPVAQVPANGYRPDLDFHGLPACAFRVAVPAGKALALRRVGDGALLPFSTEARA